MTVYLNYNTEMLRNLKTLYKYTDRFLTMCEYVCERKREADQRDCVCVCVRERERKRRIREMVCV